MFIRIAQRYMNITNPQIKLEDFLSKSISMTICQRMNLVGIKDSSPVDEFIVGGVSHYIMSNLGDYTAVWTVENYECSISGNISVDTLKK